MNRERRTVTVMIGMYCHDHHRKQGLCPQCQILRDYAWERLEKCPFQGGKTTCARCPVHCYKPVLRAEMRQVMRYSGPRMLSRHPILAIFHLIDSRRKKPLKRN